MWILKGSLLGVALFVAGLSLFLFAALRPFHADRAIGLNALGGLTIHNPMFWAALVASLVIGCAIVYSWPSRQP
jgi:hypothetical protein